MYKLARLYALPVGLEAVSMATRISGHNTLKGENMAIAAAYTGLYEAYKKLRQKDTDGEKVVIMDIPEEELDESAVEQRLQEMILEEPFGRVFHKENRFWHPIYEENVAFLRSKMAEANERFHARGYLYLNEALEMVGITPCPEGEYMGWVDGFGDSYIDFGIMPILDSKSANGFAPSVWLSFNVDGHVEDIMRLIHGENYSWRTN